MRGPSIAIEPCTVAVPESLPGRPYPVVTQPSVSDAIIPPFSALETYVQDQAVTYEGAIYIADGPIAPGPFDPDLWTKYTTAPLPTQVTVAYTAQWTGGIVSGEYIFALAVPREISFPANFTGFVYGIQAAAPVNATFDVYKGSILIGSAEIVASVLQFTSPGTSFSSGDVLVFRCTTGTTFDYLTISLVGVQQIVYS